MQRLVPLLALLLALAACGQAEPAPAAPAALAQPTQPTQLASPTAAATVAIVPTATRLAARATAQPIPTAIPSPTREALETAAPAAAGEAPAAVGPPPTPAPAASTPLSTPLLPPTPAPTAIVRGVVLEPAGGTAIGTIALDPGHGGPETGAAAGSLAEKNVNLQIALALAEMLREDGYRVVLTRDSDRPVHPDYVDSGVRAQVVLDLQARVDIANDAKADVFFSIHNNGAADPGARGTEVWYNAARPFADRNHALAELTLEGILRHLRAAGHPTVNRGIRDDANFRFFRGLAFNIYVLGPGTGARPHPPTEMPGVLGESLFLSNPTDLAALGRADMLRAIARGYRDAALAFFERYAG